MKSQERWGIHSQKNTTQGMASTILQFYASYDTRFRCVTTRHIDVHSRKVWTVFMPKRHFWKKHQDYSSWFYKKMGFDFRSEEIESNRFIWECTCMSIHCMSWNYTPKIRVIACLFNPFNCGFVCDILSEDCGGVASTILQFSGKLCKLWCSFSLCNYVTYRRTFWQSIDRFHFVWRNPFLEKTPRL